MSNSTESKPQSNNGFGGKLRSARTSRGYSLDAVAKELNILKRYVQALEKIFLPYRHLPMLGDLSLTMLSFWNWTVWSLPTPLMGRILMTCVQKPRHRP